MGKNYRRILWVDWMKTIGIYLIIVGHFFCAFTGIVYVFSVPLFFMISGYLSQNNESSEIFFSKIWNNLILPMIIICLSTSLLSLKGVIGDNLHNILFLYIQKIFYAIIGYHSALDTCWFIYTLCLVKILHYYLNKKWIIMTLLLVCIIGSYLLKNVSVIPNSWANVFVSYPFYIIGFSLKAYLPIWVEKIRHWHFMFKVGVSAILVSLLYVILLLNTEPYMYTNSFGNNYFIFILGGLLGFFLILIFSVVLDRYKSDIIITLSKGTIVILGYHRIMIELIQNVDPSSRNYSGWGYSLVILFAFYPVILFSNIYFPLILGKRVFKREKDNVGKIN